MIVSEYQVPAHEYVQQEATGRLVHLFVSSAVPVNAFLVDSANRQRYQQGTEFQHHGPGAVRLFGSFIQLPEVGPWFLIVENPSDSPITVDVNLTT
jgi:hypothetical protein